MKYTFIALVIYIAVAVAMIFKYKVEIGNVLVGALILLISYGAIIAIDFTSKTTSTEIWSGKIVSVKHTEEWDEWHEEVTETYTTTDSNGNSVTKTRTIPGYWEHHYATNYVKTTDNGNFKVYETPDGKILDDNFVNSTKELEKYFKIGAPTASKHTYENKIKSSYSIFKNRDINLEDYPDLYKYPSKSTKYLSVNRLLGNFKDKENKSKLLDEINSNLNDTDNPKNKDKVKGYKQVNLVLVNFGDKSEDYGYALQDYWENGAKNDVVVTFGTDKNGKPTWSHVFSWSEVEILKSDIREVIMATEDINSEFNTTLEKISDMIEKKFSRREFAEFDYIQIELSMISKVLLVAVLIGVLIFVKVSTL